MTAFGPPPPLTQADLLDLLVRNMDEHWLSGPLTDPSTRGILLGWIEIVLRVQAAGDENVDVQGYILSALGSAPATSAIRMQRPFGAPGIVPTTMRVRDQRGAVWRPTAAFAYPASGGVQTISVPVTSERMGYWLNTFEPPTFVFVDLPPDLAWAMLPSLVPASGGRLPYLDLHGSERQVPRATGETDDTYRHRMLLLLLKVSPDAIVDTIKTVLGSNLITVPIVNRVIRDGLRLAYEPFFDSAMPTLEGAWHLPPLFYDSAVLPFRGDLLRAFLDDTHGGWTRSGSDISGWFDVFLPTPAGPFAGVIAALADELDRRRAGGVPFAIYMGDPFSLSVLNHPKATAQIGSWLVGGSPSPANAVDALASYDADDSYLETATSGPITPLVVAGDYVASIPALSASPVSVSHVVLRAWIRNPNPDAIILINNPSFAFIIGPSTAGAPIRCVAPDCGGFPTLRVTHTDWRQYTLILERNPVTLAPWTVSDVTGGMQFGLACVSAGFASSRPLSVSELTLDLVVSYG